MSPRQILHGFAPRRLIVLGAIRPVDSRLRLLRLEPVGLVYLWPLSG